MQKINKDKFFLKILAELVTLIKSKDIASIKSILFNSTSYEFNYTIHKGTIFENLIAILINGSPNHAYINPQVKDQGNDVLCYTPDYILYQCIQAKNKTIPLSKSDIEIEATKHKYSNYNDLPFIIVSVSGFTICDEDKCFYANQGVILKDFNYIIELVNNFSLKYCKSPLSCYHLEDPSFMSNFDLLIKYDIKNNLEAYDNLPIDIKKWCTKIRNSYHSGTLNIKKKLLLDRINFYWTDKDRKWELTYNKIKSHYDKYGNTYNSLICPSLVSWIKRQINSYLDGKLSESQKNKLNSINIIDEWVFNIDLLK